MRDLLPREAERQALLSGRVMAAFDLHGYQVVSVPAFEYADVLERGLGSLDPNEVLRFVEPETGEVVALRPDMTPQVARLLATRLLDVPSPARLCYRGSVLRRRRERARRHRQIPQAGIELVGSAEPEGDLEVLSVAAASVRAAGLSEFVIDLGHAQVAASLLTSVDRAHWPGLVEALSLKDTGELVRRAERCGMPRPALAAIAELPGLHGGEEVWPRAERVLAGTPAEPAMLALRRIWREVAARAIAPKIVVDLGETWNFAYYTGVMFQLLAEGPGEPVGSGGRYDGLLERFGQPRPAAGFAVDLANLDWAVRRAGASRPAAPRVLVAGDVAGDLPERVLGALRARRVRCAPAPEPGAEEYASAWGYSHVLWLGTGGHRLGSVERGVSEPVGAGAPDEVAARVAARVEVV